MSLYFLVPISKFFNFFFDLQVFLKKEKSKNIIYNIILYMTFIYTNYNSNHSLNMCVLECDVNGNKYFEKWLYNIFLIQINITINALDYYLKEMSEYYNAYMAVINLLVLYGK